MPKKKLTPKSNAPEPQQAGGCRRPSFCSPLVDAAAFDLDWMPDGANRVQQSHGIYVDAKIARKMENALRILYGDVKHLGHWIPDPCRQLIEDALANDEMRDAKGKTKP